MARKVNLDTDKGFEKVDFVLLNTKMNVPRFFKETGYDHWVEDVGSAKHFEHPDWAISGYMDYLNTHPDDSKVEDLIAVAVSLEPEHKNKPTDYGLKIDRFSGLPVHPEEGEIQDALLTDDVLHQVKDPALNFDNIDHDGMDIPF